MKRRRDQPVTQRVVYETVCDACGKTAKSDSPAGWVRFNSGHSDWGNDSIDSDRSYDACSVPCWLRVVRHVVSEYGEPGAHPTLRGSIYDFDYEFLAALKETAPEGDLQHPYGDDE